MADSTSQNPWITLAPLLGWTVHSGEILTAHLERLLDPADERTWPILADRALDVLRARGWKIVLKSIDSPIGQWRVKLTLPPYRGERPKSHWRFGEGTNPNKHLAVCAAALTALQWETDGPLTDARASTALDGDTQYVGKDSPGDEK